MSKEGTGIAPQMVPTSKTVFENLAPHSVELNRSTKGDISYSLKVYGHNEKDAADRAVSLAEHLEAQINSRLARAA